MDISQGGNAPLATKGRVTVTIGWTASPADLDTSCYIVGANGKVPSDEHMVFYNQPVDPSGAVRFSGKPSGAEFGVDLDKLPATISRCVFAATLVSGTFQRVTGLAVTANGEGEPVRYTLANMANERAMMLGEVYRHSSGWKFRAVGQGFNGGLKALAESFGVVVDDAPPAPQPATRATPTTAPKRAAAPPPTPAAPASPIRLGKIVLDKPNAAAKLNLSKGGPIRNIGVTMTWQAGVDLDLHAFYRLKDGRTGHVYFASKGNLNGPPYIGLDRDAAVDRRAGSHEENLNISRLDQVADILFAANIFTLGGLFGLGNDTFARYDGIVTVRADQQEIVVPLTSKEPGRWAIIARIDNRTEPRVVRIDRVVKNQPKIEEYQNT